MLDYRIKADLEVNSTALAYHCFGTGRTFNFTHYVILDKDMILVQI